MADEPKKDNLNREGGKPAGAKDEQSFAGQSLWQLLQGQSELDELTLTPAKPTGPPPAQEPANADPVAKAAESAAIPPKPAAKQVPANDNEWGMIRQILETPDAMADKVDFRSTSSVDTGDMDPAIANYMRNDTLGIKCLKNPEAEAVAQCPECQAYFSQPFLVIRKGRMLCVDCADAMHIATEEEILSAFERGHESPEAQVAPPAPPEFQVGSTMFGVEGAPASAFKQILALAGDIVISRGIFFLLIWAIDTFTEVGGPLMVIYTPDGKFAPVGELVKHFVFAMDIVPWLIVFLCWDFMYYFAYLALVNRTPGMAWAGTRLATVWGEFVPFGPLALRTILFQLQWQLFGILIGAFLPHNRGFHDLMAGTIMINYSSVKRVDAYESIQIKL